MNNRRGYINIPFKYFTEEYRALIQQVFNRFIPVYIDNNLSTPYRVYHGYSEEFDVVEDCCASPEYFIIMDGQEISFRQCPELGGVDRYYKHFEAFEKLKADLSAEPAGS